MGIFRSDDAEKIRESKLANEIAENYLDKLATMQDDVIEGVSAEQYIRARNILNSKTAFQDMVDSLASRAGLKQYIEDINAEMKGIESKGESKKLDSLLDIPAVKSEVDKAVDNKKFDSYVNLLNELSKEIKGNDEIPDYLKNVMGDKKLKDYVISKMPKKNKNDNQLHLEPKKHNTENSDDTSKPYYNFDSSNDQHK